MRKDCSFSPASTSSARFLHSNSPLNEPYERGRRNQYDDYGGQLRLFQAEQDDLVVSPRKNDNLPHGVSKKVHEEKYSGLHLVPHQPQKTEENYVDYGLVSCRGLIGYVV